VGPREYSARVGPQQQVIETVQSMTRLNLGVHDLEAGSSQPLSDLHLGEGERE